jgi:hypothetical protein
MPVLATQYRVFCDDIECHEFGPEHTTTWLAADGARAEGYVYVKASSRHRDGKRYCPACATSKRSVRKLAGQ